MTFLNRIREAVRGPLVAARAYFEEQDPRFAIAFVPALLLSIVLYVRSPVSNYIFDEQEALLANPYVNSDQLPFLSAFYRDFWGLPPERSIGSYRPIPNLIWRTLWHVSHQPFVHHWVNVIGHAVNAALLAAFVLAVSGRRRLSWLSGAVFLSAAVLTEAVTGVVGIADVLGGLGVMLALSALRLPLYAMPLACFLAATFGLFSKESVIVAVPLVGLAALTTAPVLHPRRPLRWLRALLALLGLVAALVVYTELRKRWYPVALPEALAAPLPESAPRVQQLLHRFLVWFHQPSLPRDPINNPLVEAPLPLRVAAALRVYASGLAQVLCPWNLSGDYSYRAEPVPERPVFFGSVAGALLMLGPILVGTGVLIRHLLQSFRLRSADPETKRARLAPGVLLATGLLWFPVAYFPHSNIAVLLPTVRAERFWYLPALGTSLVLALFAAKLLSRPRARLGATLVGAFFGIQVFQARAHALDYMDDLTFWDATRKAVPLSAKAQLNYSVMLGARGHLQERLHYNRIARDLAPQWAMAHVYYGDTLCRLASVPELVKDPSTASSSSRSAALASTPSTPSGPPNARVAKLDPDERLARAELAFPHYVKGFRLAPNDPNLIALALQCMWEEKLVQRHEDELEELARQHPGSWLSFLVNDTVDNGEKNGGVQKKYRPRSYDEGPKKE